MTQNLRLTVAAILASLLWSCASAPPCPVCAPCPACPTCPTTVEKPAGPVTWFVTKVKDGDTLIARMEGGDVERNETIRLLNINTPEKSQPGFDEATEALKALVRGGTITLEFAEPNVEKRDGFGRLLAFAFADGVNVNLEMTRQGWSKLYTKYGKGRLHEEFVKAEAEAREAKRGLWGMHVARRAGLHIASRLLRHTDVRVTEKHYAPLGFEELHKAVEDRSADIAAMCERLTEKIMTEEAAKTRPRLVLVGKEEERED